VTAPRHAGLRGCPTESSPVQRAKCQKCCLKGVFSLPKAVLWGRFPIWRLVTRLLGLGLMAALSATKHNTTLKAFYEKLTNAGKKPIVALIAVMRKIVVIGNDLLRWACATI
jgi:hypothetical protein